MILHNKTSAHDAIVVRSPATMEEKDIHRQRSAARAKVKTEALSAKLLDAAFAITYYNDFSRRFGPPAERPPPIDLGVLGDRFSKGEINDAIRLVSELLKDAYQAGDDLRERRLTHTEAVDRLRQGHPGFSDKCYEETISKGLFESLW
ncbi:hypothetical protein [Mesorhizobium sp. NFR06]|uniref:hypothetical protein n=1 Tax=Mesorhizobium sp. NFR06 TaxID=1566290 RepID=UPI00122D8373|nr:hypothetical protein [Mesorhizobium sp. NFR06]